MFTLLLQLCVFPPTAFARSCICEKYQPVTLELQDIVHSPLPMERPSNSVVTPIIKIFHVSVNLILFHIPLKFPVLLKMKGKQPYECSL